MFRLLSDTEVALNELLVACRESIDHYQDATKLVEKSEIATGFHTIANQRKLLCKRLAETIRDLGDLPSVPDPDKEAGAMIIHHLGAALSPDYTNQILTQRITAEEHIMELIDKAQESNERGTCELLLNDLSKHAADTLKILSSARQIAT